MISSISNQNPFIKFCLHSLASGVIFAIAIHVNAIVMTKELFFSCFCSAFSFAAVNRPLKNVKHIHIFSLHSLFAISPFFHCPIKTASLAVAFLSLATIISFSTDFLLRYKATSIEEEECYRYSQIDLFSSPVNPSATKAPADNKVKKFFRSSHSS